MHPRSVGLPPPPPAIDEMAAVTEKVATLKRKEDARMADWRTGKPGGRKTKDAHRTPGMRRRGPALTKAELRAQGDQAMAAFTGPIVKLPTKLERKCGRCGESSSVMVQPGQTPPEFKCQSCNQATLRG
jgi:hypothetical protein